MAVKQASRYVKEGRIWVVDIDIEQFFDKVNHDVLMSKLAKTVGDKILLKLIRRFLTAGLMQDGICKARNAGAPQGGPLSPLLINPPIKYPTYLLQIASGCNIIFECQKKKISGNYQ